MSPLPEGLWVAWYGDDFTGAAAVMEVLAFAGVPTMLFLEPPTQAQLARYPELRAVGVASTARAQTPDWMRSALPDAYGALLTLKPQILHYKICSTLDSSPTIGSIGCAIEVGADLLQPTYVPVHVSAPQMGREQRDGQLFADFKGQMYRIDQHPVMAHHPVTPMTEPNVGRHIALQSDRIAASCWTDGPDAILPPSNTAPVAAGGPIPVMTLDCTGPQEETAAGRLLWENRAMAPFVVGSQGVEYALVRHWVDTGALPAQTLPGGIGPAKGMVTVSGSVSPVTSDQIAWSRDNGFAALRFDVVTAAQGPAQLQNEVDRLVQQGLAALSEGADPLIYTADGPADPAVAQLQAAVQSGGLSMAQANERIGEALGLILDQILTRSNVQRAIVSGGDTSGHATQQLGIFALSALAPTIPGAALFRAHANGPRDGLELALKGGQMGSPDYFGWIRDGGGPR